MNLILLSFFALGVLFIVWLIWAARKSLQEKPIKKATRKEFHDFIAKEAGI